MTSLARRSFSAGGLLRHKTIKYLPRLAHITGTHHFGIMQKAFKISSAFIIIVGNMLVPDAAHNSHMLSGTAKQNVQPLFSALAVDRTEIHEHFMLPVMAI